MKRNLFIGVVLCTGSLMSHAFQYPDTLNRVILDSVCNVDLDEVIVKARRPISTVKADRISYLPSEMVSASSSNIYDALLSIPGLEIGGDGVISFNGERGVGISVDGRKSILTSDMLIAFLKSLPASNVEKIDIQTVSGSKNDASDATVTINIHRKQIRDKGFTIGVNTDGQFGKARRFYGNVFMEYSRGIHYLSATYGENVARNPSNLFTERPYIDYNEGLRQSYDRLRRDVMHNVGLSYDCQPKSSLTIGASLNYIYFRRKEPAVMTTFIPVAANPTVTANTACFITKNIYGGLYFKRKYNRSETDLNLSLDFFSYDNSENQVMKDNIGTSIVGDMYGTTYGLAGVLDYRRQLSTNWHLSCGMRMSYVKMNNQGIYDGTLKTGYSSLQNTSDEFGYSENVNALYVETKSNYRMVSTSFGVRMEQSNTRNLFSGNESAESQDFLRNGFRFYPSLSLLVNTEDAGNYILSYSDRITRPKFADLDPFIHIFDDITHVGGNVNLKEAISHRINLAYANNSWLRISVTGEYTTDEIVKCYREITDKIVYVMPENLPRLLRLIGSVSVANIRVKPWFAISVMANLIYSNYHFPESLDSPSNVMFTPMVDVKNILGLPRGWTMELNASYRGKSAYGQAVVSSSWNSYLGIKKSFMDNNLSITMYVHDILNTNCFDSKIVLSGREALLREREFENMRRWGVALSFRFNSGKRTQHKEDRSPWIDEMNRVNL